MDWEVELATSMCRPYSDLWSELCRRLDLLSADVPPCVDAVRRRVLKGGKR